MDKRTNHTLCVKPGFPTDEEVITRETYYNEFFRLERLALSVVTWDGLPEGVSQEWIERYLFYFGNCVFFYDDILGKYVTLPIATELSFDEHGEPYRYEIRGWGDYRRVLSRENSVIIYNNFEMVSSLDVVQYYAYRLTNALRTGDVHLEANKVGKIIAVPEIRKRTVQNILERIKNFCLYTITAPGALQGDKEIKEINGQPELFVLDKIDNHYSFVLHQAYAYLGVDSVSDKQSGMTMQETHAESSGARANKNAIILPRKEAAEEINKMFGLNVKPWIEAAPEEDGGEENGEIYDNTENSTGSGDGED